MILFLTTVDYEYERHNLQHYYLSDMKNYMMYDDKFSDPLYKVQGMPRASRAVSNFLWTTLQDARVFWVVLIAFYVSFFVSCFILLLRHFRDFKKSLSFGAERSSVRDELEQEDDSKLFYVFHILAAFYVVLLIIVLVSFPINKIKYASFMTFIDVSIMMTSQYELRLPKELKEKLLDVTRRYLPPGRFWLDNRKKPGFPSVHAGINAFCAYNPSDPRCLGKSIKEEQGIPVEEMPNILLMIIESFNPSTYLIDDEFIDEAASIKKGDPRYYITDTPFYNRERAPKLRELAKEGVTFAGMNSHGMPTCSGWHAMMTGVLPSQNYVNIEDGYVLHADDVPSHMRDVGYWTYYLSGQDFDFDGIR
jgi:hypothetical protein